MAGFFKAGTLRDHRTKSKAIEVSMDLETHVLSLIIRYITDLSTPNRPIGCCLSYQAALHDSITLTTIWTE